MIPRRMCLSSDNHHNKSHNGQRKKQTEMRKNCDSEDRMCSLKDSLFEGSSESSIRPGIRSSCHVEDLKRDVVCSLSKSSFSGNEPPSGSDFHGKDCENKYSCTPQGLPCHIIPGSLSSGFGVEPKLVQSESDQQSALCESNRRSANKIQPFDICKFDRQSTHKVSPKLQPSLFAQNRERRKEQNGCQNGPNVEKLRPGLLVLKKYLRLADQVAIVKVCRRLGLGSGGFYHPSFNNGNKMHLHMMCLGRNWDPDSSKYSDIRDHDGTIPPDIPDTFKRLVVEVLDVVGEHSKLDADLKLPAMTPDICLVNFYTNSGRLGIHQDKDESHESIKKGIPVVSFSIGDSAEFLFGENRDAEKANKVILDSGDVLIFGGKSRLIYHGISTIIKDKAPKQLLTETNMCPGRLNLTFRQY